MLQKEFAHFRTSSSDPERSILCYTIDISTRKFIQAQTQPKTVLKDTRQHLDGFFENNLYTTKHRKLTSKSKMALKRINKVSP